jgi:hypothetical protein
MYLTATMLDNVDKDKGDLWIIPPKDKPYTIRVKLI